MTARTHLIEALIGVVVVIAAIMMVTTFTARTGGGAGSNAIEVSALFPNANGIDVGTDVRVAGLSIGEVTAVSLDPEGYQAEVQMEIDASANIPDDSSAAITSESLLGGSHIALLPGGSTEPLQEGAMILDTQGAVDMTGLIGSVINDSGDEAPADDGFDTMSEDFDAMEAP